MKKTKKESASAGEMAALLRYDDYYQRVFGQLPARKKVRWVQQMKMWWHSLVQFLAVVLMLGSLGVFAGTKDPMLDEYCVRNSPVSQTLQVCLTECRTGRSVLFNTSTAVGLEQCETYCKRDAVILVQQECRIR